MHILVVVVDSGVGLLHRSVAQEEIEMIIYFVWISSVLSSTFSSHLALEAFH